MVKSQIRVFSSIKITCSCGTINEFDDVPLNIDGILSFGKFRNCTGCGKQLLPRHIDYTDNDSLEFFQCAADIHPIERDEIRIPLE